MTHNTVHLHPMATWSGVDYVDPGDEAADTTEGFGEFAHPIAASTMTFFPTVLPAAASQATDDLSDPFVFLITKVHLLPSSVEPLEHV